MTTYKDIPDEIWLIVFKYIDFISLYKFYKINYFKPLITKEYKYIINTNLIENTLLYNLANFTLFKRKIKSEYIKYLYKNGERNFSNMDLSYLDLSYQNLKNINLKNSNLSFTNLNFTNLEYSNLENCNIENCELNYTNFYCCNLKKINSSYLNSSILNLKTLL